LSVSTAVGPSMYPTFFVGGEPVICWKLFSYNGLKVGDVVAARSPINPHVKLCKRIKALGGEQTSFQHPESGETLSVTVPQGHVWLEGDNPELSSDSRKYGPFPKALIFGKIVFRLHPRHFGWVESAPPVIDNRE